MVTIAEQQQEAGQRLAPNPPTVSSTSSIDTAGYCADLNDTSGHDQFTPESSFQQSASLPPLSLGNPALTSTGSNQSMDSFAMFHSSLPTAPTRMGNVAIEPLPTPAIALRSELQLSSSTGLFVNSVPNTNTVPEFLYQLTKMLTDNNRDIIEWSNGKIEVHSPHKLESQVLNRYFRHSKFASFQRQLNYFGFRKLAGKGKMAPCSYVNDSTTDELASLLLVKRKQGNEPKPTPGGKKRDRDDEKGGRSSSDDGGNSNQEAPSSTSVNPVLAGILYRSASSDNTATQSNSSHAPQQSQKALARVAVGRGIRHGFIPQQQHTGSSTSLNVAKSAPKVVAPSPVQASLNALTNNFKNSLQGLQSSEHDVSGSGDHSVSGSISSQRDLYQGANGAVLAPNIEYIPGSLRRDDSLVDLAMIPIAEEGFETAEGAGSIGFSFVDFPFDSSYFLNDDLGDAPAEG